MYLGAYLTGPDDKFLIHGGTIFVKIFNSYYGMKQIWRCAMTTTSNGIWQEDIFGKRIKRKSKNI